VGVVVQHPPGGGSAFGRALVGASSFGGVQPQQASRPAGQQARTASNLAIAALIAAYDARAEWRRLIRT
jgi:hypothetical protein